FPSLYASTPLARVDAAVNPVPVATAVKATGLVVGVAAVAVTEEATRRGVVAQASIVDAAEASIVDAAEVARVAINREANAVASDDANAMHNVTTRRSGASSSASLVRAATVLTFTRRGASTAPTEVAPMAAVITASVEAVITASAEAVRTDAVVIMAMAAVVN
ncbi:hypothetical protein Ciccas_011834, partial [Cichlidogyrus casuarinus]